MVKDRLSEMKAIQEESGVGPKREPSVFFEGGPPKDIFLETLYNQVQKVLNLIDKLRSDVQEVKRKHGEILSSVRSKVRIHQDLQEMMTDVTKSAVQIRAKLKVIKLEIDMNDADRKTSAHARIRQTQYAMLTRKFMDVMEEYNEAELDFRERCKDRMRRQLESASRTFTNEELEDMLDKGDPSVYSQAFLEESERARESLADIQARHADIVNLEKSIQQLYILFKDMSMLIVKQGDMVDNIERHVHQAGDYVETGYQEIVKARKHQKKLRRKRCILIVCLVTIIIILVIAVPIAIGSPPV